MRASARRGRAASRSLIASPRPWSGMGMTAIARGSWLQFAQHGEEIGGRLAQIAGRAQIARGAGRVAESQQHFAGSGRHARSDASPRAAHNGSPFGRARGSFRRPGVPSGPATASIVSRAIAPGRSRTGLPPSNPITVDSRPSGVGPPSRMKSTLPRRLSAHMRGGCGADFAGGVGAGRGDRHARGREQLLRDGFARHAHGDGVQSGADQKRQRRAGRRGSTSVSAPGQKLRRASAPPA